MSNVTITGMSIPNTQIPLGPDKTGICGVTNASPTVTFATALSRVYRGKGGFLIKLHTTIHYVSHVAADGLSLTTTTNYVGSTDASAAYIIYPCLELRFYCDTPFQPVGASYVVQASPIGSPNFFKSVLVSQYDAGTGDLLWMPDIVLPATGNIASPPQQKAKYFPVFYTLQGNQVAFLGGFEKGLRIPETPSSTNWPDLLVAQQTQPYNFLNEASTLSSDQVLALISSAAAIDGTPRTLLMAASGGVAAEDSALSQDVSGNLIAAGSLALGDELDVASNATVGGTVAAADAAITGAVTAGTTITAVGNIIGATPIYTVATLPTANAANVRRKAVVSDSNRGLRTCREVSSGVYAWVDDGRGVADVNNFGIVSDGTTSQTSALVTLFSGVLSSFTGTIHIPYNTVFDVATVYAALPALARVKDESEINWGQPPTYRSRFEVFGSNGTAANDAPVMIADTHHPSLVLNNLRSSGSAAALVSRASLLFGAGIRGNKDPLYTGYWQNYKRASFDAWAWGWYRYSEWNAVNGTEWATATVYAAGAYVRNGAYYYSTVAGGTSGATAPVHTSGSASDGAVTWVYVGPVVGDQLIMELDQDGNLGVGTQADNTSNLTVAEPGTSTSTVFTLTNANSSSQIVENKTAENSGGTPTTIQAITTGDGLYRLRNNTAGSNLYEASTAQFYSYVPIVSAANLTSGLAANGGSNLFTLRGYSANATNGSYGRMLFDANSNQTADARQWLITNATDKFRIIRSVDATTVPTLNSSGVVTSGTENLTIDKDGAFTLTSATASAFTVGANGATNPVVKANAATASVATGIEVTGAAAGAGVAVAAISSGTDEHLILGGKGAGVVKGSTFIQNTLGEGALNASFTRADTTLTATNLSYTVIAGRSYRIDGYLIVSNSTAGEGGKFDFGGGTCSATAFDLAVVGANGTNAAGTTVSTSLTGAINYTSITGTNRIRISGYLKVNAGGTLILRAAEDSTASGTFTLAAGSWIALEDTVTK